MKKLAATCFFLLFTLSFSYAQILSGRVCDEDTKKPVADVDIYFDGTSLGTKTDKNGDFRIPVYTIMNTNFVISHLSYEQVFYPSPFNKVPPVIYLKKKVQSLSEVTVFADQFSRKEKMAIFKEYFLGNGKAAKLCTILNEEDINLFYNNSSKTLKATAKKPLLVRNDYLGYEITFDMKEFYIEYFTDNTLDKGLIKESYFGGISVYKDLFPEKNKKIEKRRKETYEDSPNRFFKSLTHNTLKESKYRIFKKRFETVPENCFIIKDTLSMKMLQLIPDNTTDSSSFLRKKSSDEYENRISVLDKKKRQSDIVFRIEKVFIDDFGNIHAPDKVMYSGIWAQYRLGQMLPIDYIPD